MVQVLFVVEGSWIWIGSLQPSCGLRAAWRWGMNELRTRLREGSSNLASMSLREAEGGAQLASGTHLGSKGSAQAFALFSANLREVNP